MKKQSLSSDKNDRLELIRWAIATSYNMGDAIEKIGCNRTSGGGYRTLKNAILKHELDVSHFIKTKKQIKPKIAEKYTDDEIFNTNSKCNRRNVKKRFLEIVDNICAICDNDGNHFGRPLTLQLDHINGVNNDDRFENLRLLCPNCHTQTVNYGAKNKIKCTRNKNSVSREIFLKNIRQAWIISQEDNITKVLSANINFMKRGWVGEVAKILNIHRQKVRHWMHRALPDIEIVTNKRLLYLN